MGFRLYKNDNDYPGYHAEYIVDTIDDMQNVPTKCEVGSSCLVLEDSSVWVLNTEKEWVEI
jgi:hypothetical protein